MFVLHLASALAADATIQATADAIGPCDPPSSTCEQIEATAVVLTEPSAAVDGDVHLAVTLDMRAVRRLKRDDDLVIAIRVPRRALDRLPDATGPDAAAPAGVASAPADDGLGRFSVPLTEPWTSMHLPIAGGVVLFADPGTVTVVYESGAAADHAAAYRAAIAALGWQLVTATDDPSGYDATYARDAQRLVLTAMPMESVVTVSITVVTGPP